MRHGLDYMKDCREGVLEWLRDLWFLPLCLCGEQLA